MLVELDLTETNQEVAEGTYEARVTALEPMESKAGKKMLKWTWQIYGTGIKGVDGRELFDRTMLEGPGAFRTVNSYKACMKQPLDKGPFDTEMLLGQAAKITVVYETMPTGEKSQYPSVKSVSAI